MPETLTKIDFTKPELPAEANLGTITPEQQEAINRISDERNSTAYFTEKELAELRSFLEIGTATQEFEKFLISQLNEGLSGADITGETVEYSEQLDACDAYAKEILFGRNGVLKFIEDPTVQDHIAIAFSISLLNFIFSDESIDSTQFDDIVNGSNNNFTQSIIEKISLLNNITDVHLQYGGRENSICMDPNQGVAFFTDIFSGKLDSTESIKTYLEGANTYDEIDIDFTDLNTVMFEQIQNIASRAGAGIGANLSLADQKADDSERLSKFEKFLQKITTGLQDFLQLIIQFFSNEDENGDIDTQTEDSTSIIEVDNQLISQVGVFFDTNNDIVIDGVTTNKLGNLFTSPELSSDYTKSIVEHISLFAGDNSIADKLGSIFIEKLPNREDNNLEVPVIERFMQEMNTHPDFNISIINSDGSINIVDFQLLIHHYQHFTIWKTNQVNNDEIVLYTQYFEKI